MQKNFQTSAVASNLSEYSWRMITNYSVYVGPFSLDVIQTERRCCF